MLNRLLKLFNLFMPAAVVTLFSLGASAGEVAIEYAKLKSEGNGRWRISITLRHQDTGRQHHADAWRIVAEDGSVLATRKLAHPHVDEQPFTRSLSGVKIPTDIRYVYVEAHDSVHGWSPDRLEVELDRTGDRFEAR